MVSEENRAGKILPLLDVLDGGVADSQREGEAGINVGHPDGFGTTTDYFVGKEAIGADF